MANQSEVESDLSSGSQQQEQNKFILPSDKEVEQLFLKNKGFLGFQYRMDAWRQIKEYCLIYKNK